MTRDTTTPKTVAERGEIIILSGPPGAGKTTVGRILAETAEKPTAHLVTDSFYVAIKKGFIPPFLPEAAHQNEVVIDVVVQSMVGYAEGGYDVVVDGIVGPWSLAPFVSAAARSRIQLSFVVLRPSYEQAFSRAVDREGKQLKASGPIKGLYGAFQNLGPLEKNVFDSTTHSVEVTVEHVRTGVRLGHFSV